MDETVVPVETVDVEEPTQAAKPTGYAYKLVDIAKVAWAFGR